MLRYTDLFFFFSFFFLNALCKIYIGRLYFKQTSHTSLFCCNTNKKVLFCLAISSLQVRTYRPLIFSSHHFKMHLAKYCSESILKNTNSYDFRHNTQSCFILTNLLFSIISYGITTEIKLQSNHHIKIYPYFLLSKSARVDLCSFKNENTKLNKTNKVNNENRGKNILHKSGGNK